jgi:transcriptional regulator with GAF, ATPase, and Fis domain
MPEDLASAKLVVVSGGLSGEVFALGGNEVTFGRDASNTIGFPDPALSRRHCTFSRATEGWNLRDLGSSNGTFVNGIQITDHALSDGDRIGLGDSVLLYVRASAAAQPRVEMQDSEALAPTREIALEDALYLQRHPEAAAGGSGIEQGLRALLRISTVINSIRHDDDLHRELLNLLFETVPAEDGAVLILQPDGDLKVATTRSARCGEPVRVNRATVQRALTESAGILSREPDTSENSWSAQGPVFANLRSILCVPIAVRDQRFGAIYLAALTGRTFSEDHLQLATAVARIAATAVENVGHFATLEREADRLRADLQTAHNMLGESAAIRRVYDVIARVARTDTTALIIGETGTGKELVARAIHENSPRARRPFVAINCAALTESLLESELFGHERGAFTGAVAQKKGRLELAENGTVFLDEVGELAPTLQGKLLRVLQEREFERVGGTRPIKVDIRIISATNRNLGAEAMAGRFREDLYFRLNIVSIHMPPLRERRDDIPLLARHFLQRYARKSGRRVTGFSPEAMRCLMAYEWPGNVRELENAIERAVVLGSTKDVLLDDLPESIVEAALLPTPSGAADLHAAVLDTKRHAVLDAFRRAGRNYTEAARLLGVHPNYLHRLIRNLDLKPALEAES